MKKIPSLCLLQNNSRTNGCSCSCTCSRSCSAARVWTVAEHSPATRFLFTVHFTEAQVGKLALYRLRYINNTGDKGDWSTEFGALIP